MGLIHLYSATSTTFDNNGTPLVTAREAVVKRDEGFQLTFNIPISQNDLHKRVQKEMIVSAMTPDGVNYFRIWDIDKRTTDVKVTALQLLYSLDVKQVNPFGGKQYTGTTVLQAFVNSFKSPISPYTFSSSILTLMDFYTNEEDDTSTSHNALAILNKITDSWSGELMLNGFDVRMISKLGTKTDALLYEHKNIASFSDSSSMNGIVTRIYATATYTPERAEGATEDPEPVVLAATVDSPLINQYAVIYEATMEYNDARTVNELRTEILKQYSEFNVDKPERTIDVDTNIVDGTAINFGDELVLKYLVHDVDEVIRCVGYEYDPISENYIGVTLGTLEKTFLTKVSEGISASVSRQFDKLSRDVQSIQTAANGKNRIAYGPNPVPNAIEGDLWFYHPEGRPDEVELLVYQNGLWMPAPFLTDQDRAEFDQAMTEHYDAALAEIERKDAEYKEIFDDYDETVVAMDQEISDAATKAQSALEEAGISTDLAQTAKDLATTAQSSASAAIVSANQAKTDASTAVTNANQAKADASTAKTNAQTALDDAQTAITNASTAVTDAGQAKEDAQTAIAEAGQAVVSANTAKSNAQTALTDAQTALSTAKNADTRSGLAETAANTAKTNAQTALDNSSTAITNAEDAITKAGQAETSANTAKTNAQTALDNAQSALTTAGSADTKAGQAIAKANAIPTTITDIIADKNLVNGTYVDTKVNDATGAWSQELVRVEGVIDGIEIGGRNLLLDSGKIRSTTRTIIVYTYTSLSDYVGEDVVVSFDLMINEDGVLRNIYSSYPYQNNGISIGTGIQARPTEKGVWQRFSFKTDVRDWGDNNPSWTKGAIAFHDNAGANDYAVRNIKIERGNKATDWTPAPEDLYSQEEFKIFNAQYAQDVTGITGRLTTVETDKLDGSTFQTFKQSEYQVTADKVASTITRVDTAEGKITTQGTAITQQAGLIESKAEKTVVDSLSETVSSHGTSISQNATDIASKASSSSVNSLTGRVNTAETSIAQNATDIESKASQTEVDTVKGTVSTHTTTIGQHATAIASKAEKSVVDTLSGTVSNQGTLISQNATDISSKAELELVNDIKGTVDTHTTEISQNATDIASKASSASVNALTGRISTAETTITQHATAITSKASQTEVDTVKGTVSSHTTTLGQHATAISSKAESSLVNTIKDTVDTHTTDISQNATDIASKASSTSVNTLTGRVDTAESNIGQNATAITQRVTTTTYNTGIASKENTVLKQSTAPSHVNGRLWLDTSVTPNILKRSTGTAWVKATPTTPGEVGAYSQSAGAGLAGRLTTAETNITQTATAVTSKADKSVVDTLSGTVDTHTTEISQNATAIASKASSSSVSTLTGRVSTAETTITQHATSIASKASQSEVDTVKGTVSGHTTTLGQHATQISARLTSSQVNTLVDNKGFSTVNYVDNQITASASGIRADMSVVEGKIDNLQVGGRNLLKGTSAEWTQVVRPAGNYFWEQGTDLQLEAGETYTFSVIVEKVSNDSVPINLHIGLGNTPGRYYYDITSWRINSIPFGQKIIMTQKIEASHTDNGVYFAWRLRSERLATTIRFKEVKLEKGNIATDWSPAPEDTMMENDFNIFKASYEATAQGLSSRLTAIDKVGGRLSTAETNISQNATAISSKANTSTVNTLTGRVSTAETTITQHATAIASKASQSEVNTVKGTVSGHTTTLSQHATAIASKAESSLVNTIKGTVDTHTTSISQNATAIASKASTSSVNTLTGRVNTAETTITQHATQISARLTTAQVNSLVDGKGLAKVTYVDSQISATAESFGIELTKVEGKIPTLIGGVNLLTGTKATNETKNWSGYDHDFLRTNDISELNLDVGDFLTLRVYVINSNTKVLPILQITTGSAGSYAYHQGVISRIIPAGESGWMEATLQYTQEMRDNLHTFLAGIRNVDYQTRPSTTTFKKAKLEKGKVATEWTPHISETVLQGEYKTFSSSISSTVNGIATRVTNIDKKDGRLDVLDAKIDTTANSITSTVSAVEKSIPTTNLHRGTSSEWRRTTWTSWNQWEYVSTVTTGGDELKVIDDIPVSENYDYTASVQYSSVTGTTDVSIRIIWVMADGSKIESANGGTISPGNGGYAIVKARAPVGAKFAQVSLRRVTLSGSTTVSYRHVKFELGTERTPWVVSHRDTVDNVRAVSQLTQTANKLTARIGSRGEKISEFLMTDSLFQTTILNNVDGKNYLPRSSHAGEYIRVSGYGHEVMNETLSTLELYPGDVMTFSLYAHSFEGSGTDIAAFWQVRGADNSFVQGWGEHLSASGRGWLSTTFTIPAKTSNGSDVVNLVLSIRDFSLPTNRRGFYRMAKLEKGAKRTPWVPNNSDIASQTQITQLADSWVMGITSADKLVTEINATTAGVRIKGETIHLNGSTLIDNAVIKSAHIDTLNANKISGNTADFNAIRTGVLTANAIKSTHISADTAFFDKVFSTTSATDRLVARGAWITNANIIGLNADKITAGVISANRIAASSISLDKLVVGDRARILNNNNLLRDTSSGNQYAKWAGYDHRLHYQNSMNGLGLSANGGALAFRAYIGRTNVDVYAFIQVSVQNGDGSYSYRQFRDTPVLAGKTGWTSVVAQITKNDMDKGAIFMVSLRNYTPGSTDSDIVYNNAKMENGSLHTSWSPHPDDAANKTELGYSGTVEIHGGNIKADTLDVGAITGNKATFISTGFKSLNSQATINGHAIRIQNSSGEFVEMNNTPELRSDDAGGTAVVLGKGRVHFYDSRGHSKGYVGVDMHTAGSHDFGTFLSKGSGIYKFARMADATQTTYAYYTVKAGLTAPAAVITNMVQNGYLPDGNPQQFVAKGNMLSQLNGWPAYPNWPTLSAGQQIRYKELTSQTTGDAYEDIWKFGPSSQGDWRIYFAKHATFEGGTTGTSDRRLKHDIVPTQIEALGHIESLSFKEFKWNRDNKYEPLGLIAQDSGIIRVADDDMEGIDIQRAIMLGLKGIQELQEIVKEQAAKIKQLEEINNQ